MPAPIVNMMEKVMDSERNTVSYGYRHLIRWHAFWKAIQELLYLRPVCELISDSATIVESYWFFAEVAVISLDHLIGNQKVGSHYYIRVFAWNFQDESTVCAF